VEILLFLYWGWLATFVVTAVCIFGVSKVVAGVGVVFVLSSEYLFRLFASAVGDFEGVIRAGLWVVFMVGSLIIYWAVCVVMLLWRRGIGKEVD